MSLGEWRFSVSTAAALRQKSCTMADIPAIKMELLKSYRYDEVLAGQCRGSNCPEFAQVFPQILAGEDDSWFLWSVDFEVDRLLLHYVSREPTSGEGYHSSQEADRHYETVLVIGPTVLGLKFTVPPVLKEPEIVYECMMSSSGTGHSHSLQLTENFVDPTTGKAIQNVISLSTNIS